MGIFGRPFSGGQNSEIWNDVLNELAERYNKSFNPTARGKSLQNGSGLADPRVSSISSTTEPIFSAEEGLVCRRVTYGTNP